MNSEWPPKLMVRCDECRQEVDATDGSGLVLTGREWETTDTLMGMPITHLEMICKACEAKRRD